MSLPATDNFNRANGSVAGGANWTATLNDFTITSNQVSATSGVAFNIVYWDADTFPDDQYVKCKIVTAAASDGGPAARITGTDLATAKLYFIKARNGSDELTKLILGTETALASLTTYANGDIAELRPVGSTISAFRNGAPNGTPATDSAATTGPGGMCAFGGGGPYDDWEGGNVVSSRPAPLLGNLFVGPIGFGR